MKKIITSGPEHLKLFLVVPWVGVLYVIVQFPGHAHLILLDRIHISTFTMLTILCLQ